MNVRVRVRSTAPWLPGAGIEAIVVEVSEAAALERLERDDECWAPKFRKVLTVQETSDAVDAWGTFRCYPVKGTI